nr:copia protein [Tanacetum cinerariifolium]
MQVVQIVLWYLDSGCSKHMTGDRSQLINFVHKFLGTVKFRNDHVAKIMGYGDYKIGNMTISKVYFLEGLGHNLFSVRQFCDSDLKVSFCQHTCFICNLDGVNLLTGSRGNNLYNLSLQDMMASSPICLLSKASKTKSWLWHRRLSHLNFVIPTVQAESTGSPSLTSIDQDAPSPSKSQTTPETQSSVIPQDVEEDIHDIEVVHMGNDPLFSVPIPEVTSAQSSSTFLHDSNFMSKLSFDYDAFLTSVEPKMYKDALTQPCWIEAMQEELNEFERLEPDGFVDQDNPNHVYKLKKALYGLKQASRAWYDMLSLFLISQDFFKGLVDPTLFIHRNGNDLFLVQIYVDDIIFAASTPELCDLFANQMCSKVKMSMMGKISFFLGLQIFQSPRGIFINQSKYALESLEKYGFEPCDPVDTPMVEKSKLDEDKEGKAVDPSHYRGMIGTLLYLTISRPDLQFAICMCSRYQARPTEKHVHAVKRIFRYLRGTVNWGLCYSKDSSVALTTFADADHADCQDTRSSTSGSVQFLGEMLISWSSKRQKCAAISSTEAEYITLSGCCAQILWMRS